MDKDFKSYESTGEKDPQFLLICNMDHLVRSEKVEDVISSADMWESEYMEDVVERRIVTEVNRLLDERGVSDSELALMKEKEKMLGKFREQAKRFMSIYSSHMREGMVVDRIVSFKNRTEEEVRKEEEKKLAYCNAIYPGIVKEAEDIVSKIYFNPKFEKRNGELYWGRFTVQSFDRGIDLKEVDSNTVGVITKQIQRLFPQGVKVRLCLREPSEEEKNQTEYDIYEESRRSFPIFISM